LRDCSEADGADGDAIMSAVVKAFNQMNRLGQRAIEAYPIGWHGPLDSGWERLYAYITIAENVERSVRRSGELVGCVYAGTKLGRCPTIAIMSCEDCAK